MSNSLPPPDQRSLSSEQKFVQRSLPLWLQPIARWLPLGGSSFAFASFLLRQDWATALLLFPITAASGVWAAYSKNFIEQLSEIYGERGKQDAKDLVLHMDRASDALNQSLTRAGGAVVAKITSVDDRYFEAQAIDCELYKTEGMGKISGLATPMLEDVFVRLEFDRNLGMPGLTHAMRSENRPDFDLVSDHDWSIDIWSLLAKAKDDRIYKQMVILAWGGFGKTTLLRHIAYRLGCNKQPQNVPRFVPILLLLRKYRDLLTQENPLDLPTLIETHHVPSLNPKEPLKMPIDWAKNLLKQGKMLVMLDGFDEVPKSQRPLVSRWLNHQIKTYPQSVFIVTSRPKAYTEQGMVERDRIDFPSVLHLRSFGAKQRREFVEKWYWCQEYYSCGKTDTPAIRKEAEDSAADLLSQIEKRQELTALASNPLLLTMIARFHRRYPSAELPKRRVELYEEICKLQLHDRPGARELETLLTECEALVILQKLALEMMEKKEERIEQHILLDRLHSYLQDEDENVDAAEFLGQVEQISELLVQREPEEFEFAHLSFQEFLAAMEIVRLKKEDILHKHFQEDWWKSVILLYIGKVSKPSHLIRAALAARATDLAYACMQETSKRIDADLKKDVEELIALNATVKEVQTSRYQQLETHLKNQQWREADQETYRLMITTVGKEEGQWFTSDELLNFPCEELLTIDRLWRKYSNDRYGFSVQKEIYVRCGGKLDGEYPGDKIWEKFGTEVGWRVNNEWQEYIDYDDLTWNSIHVPGHLPWWHLPLNKVHVNIRCSLLSHQDL